MPTHRLIPLAAAALAVALAACSSMYGSAHAAPAQLTDGAWTTPAGMSLYVFDKDAAGSGKSACNGPCAKNWPPLAAEAADRDSGDWSVITRDDGSRQWAFKGKPLYAWSKDQKPGDKTGDGFNNVWHLAKP